MIKPQEVEPIFIGLDPSLAAIGWVLLDGKVYITGGVYAPSGDLDEKLLDAYIWLGDWLRNIRSNTTQDIVVALEMPYMGMNADTHYKLSALSGVLRAAALGIGVMAIPIVPSTRCKAIGLKGNSSKKQILERVNEIYGLEVDNFDEADAIAIALAGREVYLKEVK